MKNEASRYFLDGWVTVYRSPSTRCYLLS